MQHSTGWGELGASSIRLLLLGCLVVAVGQCLTQIRSSKAFLSLNLKKTSQVWNFTSISQWFYIRLAEYLMIKFQDLFIAVHLSLLTECIQKE